MEAATPAGQLAAQNANGVQTVELARLVLNLAPLLGLFPLYKLTSWLNVGFLTFVAGCFLSGFGALLAFFGFVFLPSFCGDWLFAPVLPAIYRNRPLYALYWNLVLWPYCKSRGTSTIVPETRSL